MIDALKFLKTVYEVMMRPLSLCEKLHAYNKDLGTQNFKKEENHTGNLESVITKQNKWTEMKTSMPKHKYQNKTSVSFVDVDNYCKVLQDQFEEVKANNNPQLDYNAPYKAKSIKKMNKTYTVDDILIKRLESFINDRTKEE